MQQFLVPEEHQAQVKQYDCILEGVQSSLKPLEAPKTLLESTTPVGNHVAHRQQSRSLFPCEVVEPTRKNSVETRTVAAESIGQNTNSANSIPPPAVVATVPSHLQRVDNEYNCLNDSQSETQTTVHDSIDGQTPFTSSDSDDVHNTSAPVNFSQIPQHLLRLPRTRPHAGVVSNNAPNTHLASSHRAFESTSSGNTDGAERIFSGSDTASTASSIPPSEGNTYAFPQPDPDLEPFPDFYQCQLAVKEEEVEDLQRDLGQVKAKAQADRTTAQWEKIRLEKETNNARQALHTMSMQFQEVDGRCQALERENTELRRYVQVLDQRRLETEGACRIMVAHIQQLENINQNLEEGNAALKNRNSYLEAVARQLQERVNLSGASRHLNAALLFQMTREKNAEVTKLREQVSSLTEQLDKASEEKWDYFAEKNDMEDERDSERAAKEKAQRQLREAREELRRVQGN